MMLCSGGLQCCACCGPFSPDLGLMSTNITALDVLVSSICEPIGLQGLQQHYGQYSSRLRASARAGLLQTGTGIEEMIYGQLGRLGAASPPQPATATTCHRHRRCYCLVIPAAQPAALAWALINRIWRSCFAVFRRRMCSGTARG